MGLQSQNQVLCYGWTKCLSNKALKDDRNGHCAQLDTAGHPMQPWNPGCPTASVSSSTTEGSNWSSITIQSEAAFLYFGKWHCTPQCKYFSKIALIAWRCYNFCCATSMLAKRFQAASHHSGWQGSDGGWDTCTTGDLQSELPHGWIAMYGSDMGHPLGTREVRGRGGQSRPPYGYGNFSASKTSGAAGHLQAYQ